MQCAYMKSACALHNSETFQSSLRLFNTMRRVLCIIINSSLTIAHIHTKSLFLYAKVSNFTSSQHLHWAYILEGYRQTILAHTKEGFIFSKTGFKCIHNIWYIYTKLSNKCLARFESSFSLNQFCKWSYYLIPAYMCVCI